MQNENKIGRKIVNNTWPNLKYNISSILFELRR